MTQFVIATSVTRRLAYDLAPIFVQEVLLKVGFCAMILLDDGGTFKAEFREMYDILKIRCHVIRRNNHQGLAVEEFHQFLNKAVTLATNDREPTNKQVIVPIAYLTVYALNSVPLDGT